MKGLFVKDIELMKQQKQFSMKLKRTRVSFRHLMMDLKRLMKRGQ